MAAHPKSATVGLARVLKATGDGGSPTGYLWAKRAMDITLSSIALVVLSPLLLAVAMAITLDSPGPAIFVHERVGYDRRRRQIKTIKMHKFRSMVHNCDQSLHQQHIRNFVQGQNVPERGSGLVKLTRDPRITRVGRFIRKTSIDELPQLWDVLRGAMSLVGPRPVPPYEVAEYAPWHRRRLEVTPGITGLWQVEGRGQVGLDEMVRMDIEYVERRSLWFDIKILLKTIPVVLSGRGAA